MKNNKEFNNYWIGEDNSILVEKNDSFFIYIMGTMNRCKLIKQKDTAILKSGGFEYNNYFDIPFNEKSETSEIIIYNYKDADHLNLINEFSRKNYEFTKYEKIFLWDSIVIYGYLHNNEYSKNILYPNKNIEIDVFGIMIYEGLKWYSPPTSINMSYQILLYGSNGDKIKRETTIIPFGIPRYYKNDKNRKGILL